MSSAAAFQPYGLITTRLQEKLYQRAHIANIVTGTANPKENETVALMEVIFSQNVFADKTTFIVNSQQPPNPNSKRACDITISYLDATWDVSTLCFAECKRTSTSKPYSLRALEEQAMHYCAAHLDHYTEKPFIYAATMAGAHIRLWRYNRVESRLQPLWGSDAVGDWALYKDIGREEDGRELDWHFGKMKGTPPTARADQGNSYGNSFSAAPRQEPSNALYVTSSTHYQPTFSHTPGPALSSPAASGYPGQIGQGPYATTSSNIILRSSQPSIPADAIEVGVMYRVVQHKRKPDEYIYRFEYSGETREVSYHEWRGETLFKDGEICSVHAYTGKRSGITFWTPTLDPESLTEYQSRRGR
jgi:hypothetical protein